MSSSIEACTKLEWSLIPAEERGRRTTYISQGEVDNTKWVAKVGLPTEALLFLAEEITYKISKLLSWKTIPKTKYLHQFVDLNGKYKKYAHMTSALSGFDQHPQGYTFQKFVNGCNLKQYLNRSSDLPLCQMSYHRAFLLNVILGRKDAKRENTMLGYPRGTEWFYRAEFFHIDNEEIGSKEGYPDALANFRELYEAKVDDYLLYEVLEIDTNKLIKVRDKYLDRTKELVLSWNQSAENLLNLEEEIETFNTKISQIMQNIELLKSSIQSLRARRKEITPGALYQEYLKGIYD